MIELEKALSAIFDAIPCPVFIKDEAHRWVFLNQALCTLLGHTREELLFKSDPDFLPAAQADIFWSIDDHVLETGEQIENEEVITDASGSIRVINSVKSRIKLPTPDGNKRFILVMVLDVTKYREAELQARYAQHDSLTGLPNRVHLMERLKEILHGARISGTGPTLLLVDLDDFKRVNRLYGHDAADEILQTIAKRLKRIAGHGNLLARVGGDEFCIVGLSTDTSQDGLIQDVGAAISQPVSGSWGSTRVAASVGVAQFPHDGRTGEELFNRAESSLLEKAVSRVDTYDGVGDPTNGLTDDLAEAIRSNDIDLAFQPIALAVDGTIQAFEALARWQHPSRGNIRPDVFIPVAEENGLMPALGRLVLFKACQAAVQWPSRIQVCVNVSPVQFKSDNIVSVFEDVLSRTGLAPERLEIEVTESVTLDNDPGTLQIFQELSKMGISMALDDFGSGWASLDALRRFPFDRLKIDRSFIAHMESQPRAAAIVRSVLNLGNALDLTVTAEGVETHSQLETLKKMGCHRIQGYLIGKPGPVKLQQDMRRVDVAPCGKPAVRMSSNASAVGRQ